MATNQLIDVAIIGGGPAGYAAAIYTARANLSTTVIEQGMSGGQIATTNEVENYPGIPLLSGVELGERFQQHAKGLGAQVEWSMVTGIDYDADASLFTVHHDTGETIARSVIACMGATPRPAGFVGEDAYRGRGVSYCATCDGMFFRGKQVFVIGGGNAACEEALFLSDIASNVTIVLRRDQFRAPEGVVQKALAKDNISVRYQTSIVELSGEAMPTTITFKDNINGETHDESFEPGSFGIFVFTGTQPHTELVEHLVDLAPDGGIVTDDSMATRTPGLFAAGDIRSKRLRQVVTAVSDGAIAATSAYAFLRG
ncbi:MAG: FAD-dependent oxidoreductase [Collinsella sp.]